jgi:hypothetical protein
MRSWIDDNLSRMLSLVRSIVTFIGSGRVFGGVTRISDIMRVVTADKSRSVAIIC